MDTSDPGAHVSGRSAVLAITGTFYPCPPAAVPRGGDAHVTRARGEDAGPAVAPGPPGLCGGGGAAPHPLLHPLTLAAMGMTHLLTQMHKYIIAPPKPQ